MIVPIRGGTPFDRLPNETLEEIFQRYVLEDGMEWRLSRFGALKLGRVCRRWRDASNAMPRLWNGIIMEIPRLREEVERFKHILSKTASHPIHLCIAEADARATVLTLSDTGPLLGEMREAVESCCRRLTTLTITLECPPKWLPPMVLKLFTDLEYPQLSKLGLYIDDPELLTDEHYDEGVDFFLTFSDHSEQLKDIQAAPSEWLLGHGHDPGKCYSWSQATSLTLAAMQSVRSVLSHLRECQDLKILDLTFDGEQCDQSEHWLLKQSRYRHGAPFIIELPRLQVLRITFRSDRVAARVMDALTLPRLELLRLAWHKEVPFEDREATYNTLNALVNRSRVQKAMVSLNYYDCPETHHGTWEASDPELRRLLLRDE